MRLEEKVRYCCYILQHFFEIECNFIKYFRLWSLHISGVVLYGGPRASTELKIPAAHSLHHEYNSLACTIEIVDDVFAAIDHIHRHGRYVDHAVMLMVTVVLPSIVMLLYSFALLHKWCYRSDLIIPEKGFYLNNFNRSKASLFCAFVLSQCSYRLHSCWWSRSSSNFS